MRVLLFNRDETWWSGGDMVQLRATMGALSQLGVEAHYIPDPVVRLDTYDLIHIFHLNFRWASQMAHLCMAAGKPYIVSTIYYNYDVQGLSKQQMRTIAERAQRLICLSSPEQQEMLDDLGHDLRPRVRVIPNGAAALFDRPGPIALPFGKGKAYGLTVGRLQPSKGHHLAAAAARELRLPLVIAGGQANDPHYPNLLRAVGPTTMALPGHLSQEELAGYYRGARVYICPSLTERMSLTLLEAGLAGCNLVSTVHNRGNEWLPGLTVVDPEDPRALAEAIQQQWERPRGWQGYREYIHEHLTWELAGRELKKLYEEVLSGH